MEYYDMLCQPMIQYMVRVIGMKMQHEFNWEIPLNVHFLALHDFWHPRRITDFLFRTYFTLKSSLDMLHGALGISSLIEDTLGLTINVLQHLSTEIGV